MLTAVEKFLTAGDNVAVLERRHNALAERSRTGTVDEPRRQAAASGYDQWLDAQCDGIDTELQRIESQLGVV